MAQFFYTALLIALAALPIVFVALAFLHAARAPQWAWAMIGRAQVMWIAGLVIGVAIAPLGVPAAVYYFWKIRPMLDAIDRGDVADAFDLDGAP